MRRRIIGKTDSRGFSTTQFRAIEREAFQSPRLVRCPWSRDCPPPVFSGGKRMTDLAACRRAPSAELKMSFPIPKIMGEPKMPIPSHPARRAGRVSLERCDVEEERHERRKCFQQRHGAEVITLCVILSAPVAHGERVPGDPGTVSRSCMPFGAQESVSVHWGPCPILFPKRSMLWTASAHYAGNGVWLHNINTVAKSPQTSGWEFTWRSYAGHFASEFWTGRVVGYHYIIDGSGIPRFIELSEAHDCNLGNWGQQCCEGACPTGSGGDAR